MMEQILNFIISAAHAETIGTPASPQSSALSFLMMFVVFFLFIYFAVWRPQSKRAKEMQAMLSSLAKGDEIMTAGGILGRVTKIADQFIALEIANNVEIMLQKDSIVSVMPKGTLKSVQ